MATLTGTLGNDTLIGTVGDDLFLGDTGSDTAVIAVVQGAASFSINTAGQWVVSGAGSDTLTGIESVSFSDGVIQLGAVTTLAETRINTFTTGSQQGVRTAALSDGGYVAVWQSDGQDGGFSGIYLQRFDKSGVAIGSEMRVNDYAPGAQMSPTVSGLPDGGFIVGWITDELQLGGSISSGFEFRACCFDAGGNQLSPELTLGSAAVPPPFFQMAALADGTWVSAWADGMFNAEDVYVRRYSADGTPLGDATAVNTTLTNGQVATGLTALSGGGYIVCWQGEGSGDTSGAFFRLFAADGTALGGEVRANTTTASAQYSPVAASLDNGGFVLAWTSSGQDGSGAGVYAQRYDAGGVAQGGETRVNTYTSGDQQSPAIAALAGGGYVVAWTSSGQDGSSGGIYAQRYDNSGVALGSETRINGTTADNQYGAQVTALADGGYLIAWSSNAQDGSSTGVYSQRFDANGSPHVAATLTGDAGNNVITSSASFGASIDGAAGDDVLTGSSRSDTLDGGTGSDTLAGGGGSDTYFVDSVLDVIVESDAAEVDTDTVHSSVDWTLSSAGLEDLVLGGSLNLAGTGNGQANRITGNDGNNALSGLGGDDRLDGGNGNDTLAGSAGDDVLVGGAGVDTAQLGVLLADASFRVNRDGKWVVGSGEGNDTLDGIEFVQFADSTVALPSPVAPTDTHENTLLTNAQRDPAVAVLAAGGQVVAWTSWEQDGSGAGVYFQLRDAAGVALGSEMRANVTVSNFQDSPDVCALAGGGFVIAWSGEGAGDTAGVFACRFDAEGAAVGGEFLVNTYTGNTQSGASLLALDDGGFLVAWSGEGSGVASGVFLQRYAADGSASGTQVLVDGSAMAGQYGQPALASLAGGGYVVTWPAAQAPFHDVFQQRFTADGNAAGDVTPVNASTSGDQFYQSVAGLNGGGHVVVWTSVPEPMDMTAVDGSGSGIFLQRFNADGEAAGTEVRVNTYAAQNQVQADVAALADGGFVVVWSSEHNLAPLMMGETSNVDIFAQRFDADGNRQGSEHQVNILAAGAQDAPVVAALADGGYVVSWHSDAQDGNGYEVFSQRFDANGELAARGMTFSGNSGDDVLESLPGVPSTLEGGIGNDTYIVHSATDVIVETSALVGEIDTVISHVFHWALGDNLENLELAGSAYGGTGNSQGNLLTGNDSSNLLQGGEGNDTLDGLAGSDELSGDAGNDSLQGGNGNDVLSGVDGNDTLTGGSGNDTLDGGIGDDSLLGGNGSDRYVVDSALDVVREYGTQAGDIDSVWSSVGRVLENGIEKLQLTGDAGIAGSGNSGDNALTGNSGNNSLSGLAGNDTLDGASGVDTLVGGNGSDLYVVGLSDVVKEFGTNAGDIDTVWSSTSWTLGANLENLHLKDYGALTGTGNELANYLRGNSSANSLVGAGGDDTLEGLGGADTLVGGYGNDVYVVNGANDVVREAINLGGQDTVQASVNWSLGTNLESLVLTGNATTGTGNGLSNDMVGNELGNVFDGGSGNDTIAGMGGADTLLGGNGQDVLHGGDGYDELTGGYGSDTLSGGSGVDSFVFSASFGGSAGFETITDFVHGEDKILVKQWLTNLAGPGQLGSQHFAAGASASDADDRFIYDIANGRLYYDADGNGAGARLHIAIFSNGVSLDASDFLIV